jgi:membrane associated rhomboid family serine protease
MIYLKCQCGSGLGVPGSFLGEPVRCDECERTLRLVAAQEVTDGRAVRWQFRVVGGPKAAASDGELILLGGESPVDAGSGEGRHLKLPGTLVSRAHCRLVPLADGWVIEDTDSRNGTFVNGSRVARQELRTGDLVNVGEWTLEYGPVGPPARGARSPDLRSSTAAPSVPPPLPSAAAAIPLAARTGDAPATSSTFVPASQPVHARPTYDPAIRVVNDDYVPGFVDDEYEMVELPPEAPPAVASARRAPGAYGIHPDVPVVQHAPAANAGGAAAAGPACPSCHRRLGPRAQICVECGIDLKTGRPLLTAHGLDEDALQIRAENTIRLISWAVPFFICPVASEARGHSKPWAIWTIAGFTVLCSFMFYVMIVSAWPGQQPRGADLMLWAGDRTASEERAVRVQEEITQIEQEHPDLSARDLAKLEEVKAEASRPSMQFQPHQLLTHALLHGGLGHIAGNFVFLFVLGMRVNALIGNLRTAIIYPLLAIGGALAHLVASSNEPASPMIGASGAIMGLAGMYLVLFPAYKVHMAIWLRFLLTGFRLFWTTFAVRGFWVVLFYIAFDVVATIFGSEDNVAHWAHLGGFMTGVAIALFLLFTRSVNAYGGDLLSVALGRYAWPLLGRPGQRHRTRTTPVVNQGAAAAA